MEVQDIRLVGVSAALETIRREVNELAPLDVPVFVGGESGVGKELVARGLHFTAGKSPHRFIPVNCASLTGDMVDSELFGHVRGAFTGAMTTTLGFFGEAAGGTLFFDEVCDLPLAAQAKLLRALDEGCYRRVGDPREQKANVRFVAASNRDLAEAVQEGRLREDFCFRVTGARIVVPPLRMRTDDIMPITQYFLELQEQRYRDLLKKSLSQPASDRLVQHTWPGNVRELRHVIDLAYGISANRSTIDFDDLRFVTFRRSSEVLPSSRFLAMRVEKEPCTHLKGDQVTKSELEALLDEHQWNRQAVAATLGIAPRTLYRVMVQLGIQTIRNAVN